MRKIRKIREILFLVFSAVFLFAAGTSFAATAPTVDPVHTYKNLVISGDVYDNSDAVYGGLTTSRRDADYFYQLRDVSGTYDGYTAAGSQWFAVVPENWFRNVYYTNTTNYPLYMRTLGGEAPTITLTTSADLLHNLDFVYIQEPQPYAESYYFEDAMKPLINLFLVVKEGQGEFNVNFGNHYARHFPYWWNESEYYNNTNEIFNTSLNELIYQYDDNGIYDLTTSKNTLYTISGDEIYSGTSTTLVYTISNDNILDTSENVVYTFKRYGSSSPYYYFVYDADGNSAYRAYNGYIYYNSRTAREDVKMTLSDYSVRVQPSDAQDVAPGKYLSAKLTLNAEDTTNYGSTRGTLAFRQAAKLDTGYSSYRENSLIPIVVANVSDGTAADNELYFDMILSDTSGDVLNRIKFRWGADDDLTQDLGNIFLASSANTSAPQYNLETRITNRTGTRYRVQRYDQLAWGENVTSTDVGDNVPAHWMFDLTSDGYQSLPKYFYLDTHSQIAPGLITVYNGGIDMTYSSSRSFRIYPFSASTYKTLTLTYQRIRDVNTTSAHSVTYNAGTTSTRGLCFEEGFIDRGYSGNQSYRNTSQKLQNIMGLPPVMVSGDTNIYLINSALSAGVENYPNIGTSKYYPIRFNVDVSQILTVDHDYVDTYNASGELTGSTDNGPNEIPLLPVTVRFEIPRGDELLTEANWAALYDTSNAQTLLQKFMQFGTIGVRSPNAAELDVDLLTALDGEISSSATGSSGLNKYIKAFLIEDKDDKTNDKLILEFIAFLADAKSREKGKTAFIKVFEDGGVPYILIGDGAQDDKWTLSFFVTTAGGIGDVEDDDSNTFPAKPITYNKVTPKENSDGTCTLPVSSSAISSSTIFYIWLSTTADDASFAAAASNGTYALRIGSNSGSLTIDPNKLYSDPQCTNKASIGAGSYYITYLSADGQYSGYTEEAVKLAATNSSSKGGGGGGGGCNASATALSLILIFILVLNVALNKKLKKF